MNWVTYLASFHCNYFWFKMILFHRRTGTAYVYNRCLAWYEFVTLVYTTPDSALTCAYFMQFLEAWALAREMARFCGFIFVDPDPYPGIFHFFEHCKSALAMELPATAVCHLPPPPPHPKTNPRIPSRRLWVLPAECWDSLFVCYSEW